MVNGNFLSPAPQPAQWSYGFGPSGRSLASYPGDVQFTGNVTSINSVNWVNVQAFGAKGDGVSDDTAAIQAAAAYLKATYGGGVLYTPASSGDYMLRSPINISSGVMVYGDGERSCWKADTANWVGTGGDFLLQNENKNVSVLTDKNIRVEKMRFDWNGKTTGTGIHAISFRYVDRVDIVQCRFRDGGNATALMACRTTLVFDCTAENQRNCFYDHWDGALNAMVVNCTGITAVDINQGIQFTGTASDFSARSSVDCLVMGCRVEGVRNSSTHAAAAIIANANAATSTSYNLRSIGNVVKNSDNGIVFSGAGGNHESIGDTLDTVDQLPIFCQRDVATNSPSNCRIIDPHLINCNHAVGNVAMISLSGTHHEVRGVHVTNSGAAAYLQLVWLTSFATNCIVEIMDAPSGSGGGRIQNDGGNTNQIADQPYSSWIAYTPTIGAGSGSFTSATASGRYKQIGKIVYFWARIVVTTNGTAAGNVQLSLPVTNQQANNCFGAGRDSTAGVLCIWSNAVSNTAIIVTTGGAYPAANGSSITISGSYEAA